MAKKVVIKDEKAFKTAKNRALGSSIVEKVVPGDLVTWKTWSSDLISENFEEKTGLLVEIIEENRLENLILIGKIIPFGASEYEFIPLISLRKIQE